MSRSKEIECLERLNEMAVSLDEILQFLMDEKIIVREQIKTIKSSSDHAKQVQAMLESLRKSEKLQLLEYEWKVLPIEHIKILIVTDRNQKEFCYDGG